MLIQHFMVMNFSREEVEGVGRVLRDPTTPLVDRFRALFTLRGIATAEAVDQICSCFSDRSALLKHELAYCLGQIQNCRALPTLVRVLEDEEEDPMVRHEAGEAMGAIGDAAVKDVLVKFVGDPVQEVAETCQLSMARLNWLSNQESNYKDNNPYNSIDPAPPSCEGDVNIWRCELTDASKPLFSRYRALFALRNHGGEEAVQAIVSAFQDSSALFKHELAYVLGQMKDAHAIPGLVHQLGNLEENPMVRHECAEALGSIATERCLEVLKLFKQDKEIVVRESCEVAIDMYKYEKGKDFQYANTL